MQKNVTGQKWRVFAFDATTNLPKTGDEANITAKLAKDWGTKTTVGDTNPTEIEDGYYEFDITQVESNGNNLDLYPESSTTDIVVVGVPGSLVTTPPNYSALSIESDGDIAQVNTCVANTDMRGTDSAALDSTVAKEATVNGLNNFDPANDTVANVTAVATTTINTDMRGTDSAALASVVTEERLAELDISNIPADLNLLQDSVDNIGGGILRIQSSLVDQILDPTNDKWIKVLVVINDALGILFDPADILDPGVGREYNGAGAVFSDISSNKVTMYKDNLATPLDTVGVCHHTAQSNQPQTLERDATGIYYFWMNATLVGNLLPAGQLKALFGFFDIAQTAATYSGSSPFLIQDTNPSSHVHILDVINVLESTGTDERLDDIESGLGEIKGAGFDTGQHSLTNIKNTIG